MTDSSVAVVVTTFEPGPMLMRLLDTLVSAGVAPIVVDDGSREPPVAPPGVDLVPLPENRGIAAALNVGVARAVQLGADRVITLDQDSTVAADFVVRMTRAWSMVLAAGLRPAVIAPGDVPGITYRGDAVGPVRVVPEVMQSGAMFAVDQIRAVGGFDESLVIDCVDTDMCLRLRAAGWDVAVVPVAMEHQLGRARELRVPGRTLLITRHLPFRDYYMVRNRVLVIRDHARQEPRWALSMARRTVVAAVLTALFDNDRRRKLAAMGRGFRDGVRGRRGPLSLAERRRWASTGT